MTLLKVVGDLYFREENGHGLNHLGYRHYIYPDDPCMAYLLTFIYHRNHLNVGKYTTHGSYGIDTINCLVPFHTHLVAPRTARKI